MPHPPGRASLASLLVLGLSGALWAAGCATTDPIVDPASTTDPSSESDICLLHNCGSDFECGGCSEGRNTCLVEEARCVACDAATDSGCPDGEYCSSWGNCVPDGVTCSTDSHGVPDFDCASSADCVACDPLHQVCDTAAKRCVSCSPGDTSACQSTEQCVNGACEANCPSACAVDADCGSCGAPGHEAHACNGGHCAECSDTMPCAGGETCSAHGVCEEVCGSDGDGKCASDADCSGCGADNTSCHKSLGSSTGQCGPAAAGCSDIGNGVVVLPDPWSQVTNTCSNDNDCGGVGLSLNVGEMLRDLTGFDEINDAYIDYGMNVCASVQITGDTSCGVCVPCRVDSDCQPIDIDQVAGDAFGPLGAIAAALLLDQIFGPNEHEVNMYCQSVAGDYGVCAPCPGLLWECGVDDGGGGGNDPVCHDECVEGAAMETTCGGCVEAICDYDPFCCESTWDDLCVARVDELCSPGC